MQLKLGFFSPDATSSHTMNQISIPGGEGQPVSWPTLWTIQPPTQRIMRTLP